MLAVIAFIDFMYQRHTHVKSLKMSKQEQKDEHKQTEGSPEVKAKIRRMQMEKSANAARQTAALDDVASATAVITNPTHFAVALKYDVPDHLMHQKFWLWDVVAIWRRRLLNELTMRK